MKIFSLYKNNKKALAGSLHAPKFRSGYLRFSLTVLLASILVNPVLALDFQPRIVGGAVNDSRDRPYMAALLARESSVELITGGLRYSARPMSGVPMYSVSGVLVDCGRGIAPCPEASQSICLFERGDAFFSEMVEICREAGGLAAIVYNNAEEDFFGIIEPEDTIPAISAAGSVAPALLSAVGSEIEIEESLIVSETNFCGGAYIGGDWIITAAHCVDDMEATDLLVNVGTSDLSEDKENVLRVNRVEVHSGYDAVNIENDIALLQLESVPEGIERITFISEAALQSAIDSQLPTVAMGWGQQVAVVGDEQIFDSPVTELFEVTLPLISNQTCNTVFNQHLGNRRSETYVSDGMICAGVPEGGLGTCFGDSGGPLVLEDGANDHLVGLTSWGLGCAQADFYDVFTRVSSYTSFVESHYPDFGKEPVQIEPEVVENEVESESENEIPGPSLVIVPEVVKTEAEISREDLTALLPELVSTSDTNGGGAVLWLLSGLQLLRLRRKSTLIVRTKLTEN